VKSRQKRGHLERRAPGLPYHKEGGHVASTVSVADTLPDNNNVVNICSSVNIFTVAIYSKVYFQMA
jgi:hypothetical protein